MTASSAKRVAMGKTRRYGLYESLVLSALLIGPLPACRANGIRAELSVNDWQSPAQIRQVLKRAIKGTLLFDNDRNRFETKVLRTLAGGTKNFDLSGARELVIIDYENRHGMKRGTEFPGQAEPADATDTAGRIQSARREESVIKGLPIPKQPQS